MKFTYEPLEEYQLGEIHQAVVDLLGRHGVLVKSKKGLELCQKHGCVVDGNVVKIPEYIIDETIRLIPKAFQWEGTTLGNAIQIGNNPEKMIGTIASAPFIIEMDGNRRDATMEDNINFFKLAQSSDVVDYATQLICYPVDKDLDYFQVAMKSVINYYKYANKPFLLYEPTERLFNMAMEVSKLFNGKSDGKFIACALSPISPLSFDENYVEMIMLAAEHDQIVVCEPASICGMTGPIKAIDDVVLTIAENLATFAIAQMKKPGTACMFSNYSGISDSRYMTFINGAPEVFRMLAMTSQMTKYYDIPFQVVAGNSDARACDAQAGIESTMNMVCMQSSVKADALHCSVGALDSWNSNSFHKFIQDEEIIRGVKKLFVPVEDLSVNAVDKMIKVGPGGSYVNARDTLKNYRTEFWRPNIMVRKDYNDNKKDNMTFIQRLDYQLKKRIEEYKPLEYSPTELKELERIGEKYLNK